MGYVDHTSFTINRSLDTDLASAYRAFSEEEAKRSWFTCHENMEIVEYALECRAGGREINRIRTPEGREHLFLGHYLDTVPLERIVYAYSMHVDDIRLSASLVTIEFREESDRTAMTYTEQIAMLDGHQDIEERIHGTMLGLDMLAAKLGQI